MSQVQISVILPVYNCKNYVYYAIQSVLTQSCKDFELIIINDGSTDNSVQIIQSFNDSRIKFINNKKNSGLINTLNEGIKLAKGKYIARMDADDICLPERFAEQLKVFEKNKKAVIVATDYFLMTETQSIRSYNYGGSDELKAVLLFSPCFAHPTVMMKNIFVENNLFYDENFVHAEDYKLWMDLSSLGEFANVNQALFKYRSHPAQISILQNKTQKTNSETLRKYYLLKCGFVFNEQELETHQLIGNNVFLNSLQQLTNIELWLSALISQNNQLKIFETNMFANVIHKFWLDSCGNTNLGLKAYRFYFGSGISKLVPIDLNKRIQLIGKCLLRKFRK